MNLKRVFGALLTLLGIGGIIYAAVVFANGSSIKEGAIYGAVGLVFFISGISLVKRTKDES
ncbi:hypothetical protein [Flavobacterium litorale]|uniref:Uncharacterized protein n=1 Tax=Flavobacterium litorale TaxID=2856519 RepID=A0ABX8V5C0_9FLAO|nr:hypothetical protein [Flavobacterium litorale]QYJ68032.1 hypothetical protein K1I41_10920 [Flavobacterium litorale]